MNLSELQALAPGGRISVLRGIEGAWSFADTAGINTPLRICHFLSQLAHESDSFRAVEEYASGEAYEGRKDLGNTVPGDGTRFKGRGLIQCTGRSNYTAFTKWARARYPECPDFVDEPKRLGQFPWAFLSAVWYWDTRKLNAVADKNDIRAITKKINGGQNGLADRRAWFRKAVAIWGDGSVNPIGKPAIQSRTVKAAAVGGAATLASLGEQAYQAQQLVDVGRNVSDATGIPFLTIALAVIALGAIAYIVWDRFWISKNEGL